MRHAFLLVIVLLASMASVAQVKTVNPAQRSTSEAEQLKAAHEMLERGDVNPAMESLKALQTANPALEGLNRDLGVGYYKQGDYLKASVYLEKAVAEDANDKEATQLLGLAYYYTGKPKLAIPLLEKVQSWYPTAHVDASYVLGICYIQATDYVNARKAFATMYGVAPDSAAAHMFVARMLLRQGYDPIAEQELKKASELDPKLPTAHQLLGELYIFKSRIPEAIKEFQAEMAVNPGYAAAYYRLADAYTRVMKWDEAERLLQQSIWLDATASGPYILMGKVLLKKNDPELAVRSLHRAIAMDPNNYITHNLLGQAYRALGKTSQAEAELRISQKLQDAQSQNKAELQ